jgi:tRNA dimethylallyltransferase
MLKQGLGREAKRLLKRRLSPTAAAALGLKEMRAHFSGECSFEEAVSLLKQHTRNYAKRQIAWFRHEKDVVPVSVGADESPRATAEKLLRLWKEGAP